MLSAPCILWVAAYAGTTEPATDQCAGQKVARDAEGTFEVADEGAGGEARSPADKDGARRGFLAAKRARDGYYISMPPGARASMPCGSRLAHKSGERAQAAAARAGAARVAAAAKEETAEDMAANPAAARDVDRVAAALLLGMQGNAVEELSLTEHDAVEAQDALLLFELTYRDWHLCLQLLGRWRSSSPPHNLYNDPSVFTSYGAFVRAAACVGEDRHWDCAPSTKFTGNLLHATDSFVKGVSVRVEALLLGTAKVWEKELKHFVSASSDTNGQGCL